MTPEEARPVIEAACMAAGVEAAEILDAKATRSAEAKAVRAAIMKELSAAGVPYQEVAAIVQRHRKSRSAELLNADRRDAPLAYEDAARAARAEIRRLRRVTDDADEIGPRRQKRRDPSLFWVVRNGELRLCGPVEKLAEIAERNRRAQRKTAAKREMALADDA